MLRLMAAIAALMVCAQTASAEKYATYRGADAGALFITVAGPNPSELDPSPVAGVHYVFTVRTLDGKSQYRWTALTRRLLAKPDFEYPKTPSPPDQPYRAPSKAAAMVNRSPALPPGDYELTQIVVEGDNGLRETLVAKPNTLQFSISPRGGTYLGELRAFQVDKAKVFNFIASLRGWDLTLTDTSERDVPLIRSKHPDLAGVSVQFKASELPDPRQPNSPG